MPLFLKIISVVLLLAGSAAAADLPERLRENLDRAKVRYKAAVESARDDLLSAFDKRLEEVPRSKQGTVELRQALINALHAEKKAFQEQGTIPFSPAMRTASADYLKALAAAQKPLAEAWDDAIEHHQKVTKDNKAANELVARKNESLAPRSVGTWLCATNGAKAVRDLQSDGTIRDGAKETVGTWRFDGARMFFAYPNPTAPNGTRLETVAVAADGQSITIRGPKGGVFTGTLVGKLP